MINQWKGFTLQSRVIADSNAGALEYLGLNVGAYKIIGLSFYWIRYSTWKGKFLFLEDFVIKGEYRRQCVGSKLFEETINICKKQGLNGIIWQVLDWNHSAIEFYKKYNAEISKEWLNGKLSKNQIDKILINKIASK